MFGEGQVDKKPTPADIASAFDAGSWAAMLGLIKVLHGSGILSPAGLTEVCADMRATEERHRLAGLIQLADAVRAATEKVALIADETG